MKNSRRENANLVKSSRWVAYAAAGAASAVAAQNTAEAAITYSGPVNVAVGTNGFASFSVGSAGAIFFSHLATATSFGAAISAAFFQASGAASGAFRGFSTNGFPYASNLAYGQDVGAGPFLSGAGTLAYNYGYGGDQFLAPGIGYLGFQFDDGGGTQFGWARVDMDGSPQNTFTVVDYAYGDVGEAIFAGQTVPAPGSLGLLALGALGIGPWRRKRAEKAA